MTTKTLNPKKRLSFDPGDISKGPFTLSSAMKPQGVKLNDVYYQCYACSEVCTALRDLSKHWDEDHDHAAEQTWSHWRPHKFAKDAKTGKHVEYYVAGYEGSTKIWKPCDRTPSTNNRSQNDDAGLEELNYADRNDGDQDYFTKDDSHLGTLATSTDGIRRSARKTQFNGSFAEILLLSLDGQERSSDSERSKPYSPVDREARNPARNIEDGHDVMENPHGRNPVGFGEQTFSWAFDESRQRHETNSTSPTAKDERRDYSERPPSHLVADDGTPIKQEGTPDFEFSKNHDVHMQEATMTNDHDPEHFKVD